MLTPTIKLRSLDNSSTFESPQPRSPQGSPKVAVYRKKTSSDVAMKDYFSTKMQLRKEMSQCRSPQNYSEDNPLSFSQGPQSPTSQSPASPSHYTRDKIKQIYLPSVKEMREFTPIYPKLRLSKSPSPSVRHNTLAILQEDLRMASQRKNIAMQSSVDFYKSDKKSVSSPKNSVVESPKMSQTQQKFNMTASNKFSPYVTFMKESSSPIKNRRKKMLSMSAYQFYKMPSAGL